MFFLSKRRLTIFFNYQRPLVVDVLPKGATVTSSSYVSAVIHKLVSTITEKPKVRTRRSILLHDNASSNQPAGTRECLASHEFTVLDDSVYLSDLASCDFWLFQTVKSQLSDRRFSRPQDLARAVWAILRDIPSSEYRSAMEKWISRLRTCVEQSGD